MLNRLIEKSGFLKDKTYMYCILMFLLPWYIYIPCFEKVYLQIRNNQAVFVKGVS